MIWLSFVIEPELVFAGLKTVLDRPPMAFGRHPAFRYGCLPLDTRWAKKAEITIGDMSTDKQTACPKRP